MFKQLMIKQSVKEDLDKMCFEIGKQSYTKIILFLLDFYHTNKVK
jgi:hypothetical protein